jgi:hypothetical protein
MMENDEVDNDFIGGTGDDADTAPPMENEVDNDFIGGTGDDDDDTAPPPLGARSHNVLQQLDDEVLNMRRRPWKAVLPVCVDHVTMDDG